LSEEASPATEEESTPPPKPMTLEERVAFLEAQNEGLKRVGGLALVLVLMLGAIVVHQNYSDLRGTTTRGLTLLNDRDELSSAITVDPDGRTQFLQARYGSMAGAIALPKGFTGYAFYDTDGLPRVLIGENEQKHTVFQVIDPVRNTTFSPFKELKTASPGPGASATPAPNKTPEPTKGSPTPKPTP
jgi:hypothetical protein